MKMCPNCRNQIPDESVYCPICGTGIGAAPQFDHHQAPPASEYTVSNQQPTVPSAAIAYVDPYDHTADFSASDISENKTFAMVVYLLGPLGILIALLAAPTSRYVAFHVRQGLKLTVAEILGALALVVVSFLLWIIRLRPLMFLLVAGAAIGLIALHLLCFFGVTKGKAKEACFVRALKFLK